jgi:hypothetical protein
MPTGWCDKSKAVYRAVAAYRAETTPPLRSRAEVDAEIGKCVRAYLRYQNPDSDPLHENDWLKALASEPTAKQWDDPQSYSYGAAQDDSPLTDHDQDTREERPCGCEEAEALKDQNTELCRLLGHVHGTVAGLAKLLETLP